MKPASPRMREFVIPKVLRSRFVGPGGTNIKRISEATDTTIELPGDSDVAVVFAMSEESMKAAETLIDESLGPQMMNTLTPPVALGKFSIGSDIVGTVSHTTQFGAILELDSDGSRAFLHIAELRHEKTLRVEDVVKVGDKIDVRVIDVDFNGRFKVSRRARLPLPDPDATPDGPVVAVELPDSRGFRSPASPTLSPPPATPFKSPSKGGDAARSRKPAAADKDELDKKSGTLSPMKKTEGANPKEKARRERERKKKAANRKADAKPEEAKGGSEAEAGTS